MERWGKEIERADMEEPWLLQGQKTAQVPTSHFYLASCIKLAFMIFMRERRHRGERWGKNEES